MTRRATGLAAAAFAALVALAGLASCGEVPTLPGGVAFITPVLLPSPTIAFGDTMRDSAGRAAPLRVYAVGRDSADTIRTVAVRYLLTSLNTGATIGGEGFLVAPDTLATLRLVAQVTDPANGSSLQLQTPEVSVEVVPLADSIARTSSVLDTARIGLPGIVPLDVVVTGQGPSARGTVNGIRVYYRIASIFPAGSPIVGRYFLAHDNAVVLRPDSTLAIDTTAAGGVASRSLYGIDAPAGERNADSIVVEATARSQRGLPLRGSPVRFTIRIRH